jgi:hypothetical protein
VVNQQTEEAFEQAYQELKRLYADQQALVSYQTLRNTQSGNNS